MSSEYFASSHCLRVVEPFWANYGAVFIPKGTRGKVIKGQNLYGYVTVEFCLRRRKTRERTVVTDYSMYVEDLDFRRSEN
jgi:hypothetical protein